MPREARAGRKAGDRGVDGLAIEDAIGYRAGAEGRTDPFVTPVDELASTAIGIESRNES